MNTGRLFNSANGQAVNQQLALSNYIAVNSSGELRRAKGVASGAANGMFAMNVPTKFGEVSDGTSNTLMIGERAWQTPHDTNGFHITNAAVVLATGGSLFARADGSVTFLSNGVQGAFDNRDTALTDSVIDTTWEALLGKDDGAVLGDYE